MLKYLVVSTGSCGNCYVFYNGCDSIVIDFGISVKRFKEALENNNIPEESIKAVFITHLHPDHIDKSLSSYVKTRGVKVYINKYSVKKDHHSFVRTSLSLSLVNLFLQDEEIVINDFLIKPIEAFHDSPGCVSYILETDASRVCLITDTGCFSDEMVNAADSSNLLFLESNYDDDIIDNGPYPMWLKKRIRSTDGHLSNEQARRFLSKLSENLDRKVYLVHLSENNNTLDAVNDCMKDIKNSSFITALERGKGIVGVIEK